jgi:PAS domain S-box-containing protein
VTGVAEGLIQTALLGEAVDAGPALVFVADEEMRYMAVSRSACEELGYTREELLQLPVTKVAREQTAPSEYDEMLARGSRAGVSTLTRKDGTTFTYRYRAMKTTVAGLHLFVSIGFADHAGDTVDSSRRRSPS